MMLHTIYDSLRLIAFRSALSMKLNSDSISTLISSVLRIFTIGNYSEIAATIVECVSVDVVNLPFVATLKTKQLSVHSDFIYASNGVE